MKNNEIKRCPKCGAPCELARGCKFMRCASSICSKKTFFCWLCEQILKENDHYIHYKNDPYGNWCTNMTSTVG